MAGEDSRQYADKLPFAKVILTLIICAVLRCGTRVPDMAFESACVAAPSTMPSPRPPDGASAVSVSLELIASPEDEADPQPWVWRIRRHGCHNEPTVVRIKTGGTTIPESDYLAPPERVTIPVGREFVDLYVYGIDDDIAEGVESLELSISIEPAPATAPAATQPAEEN